MERLRRFWIFPVFFALYALTAQRGLGWGDSGLFQHWVLDGAGASAGCGFATLHPLYLAVARIFAHTPYAVTLCSAFFGALAVALVASATRSAALATLFGLSHMVWWLSCVAEVQTMNIAATALGVCAFLNWLDGRGAFWFGCAMFVAGVQLNIHNFATLLLPVYAAAAIARKLPLRDAICAGAAFACGAAPWLFELVRRGPRDVLVGAYGDKVAGVLPADWKLAAFNLALAALSFAVPAILAARRLRRKPSPWLCALLAINALFFIRYFVPDQATFLLPTLLFAYLAIGCAGALPSRREFAFLAALQIALPLCAFAMLRQLPQDEARAARHPFRDDAAYFALPWKFNEDSADRAAAALGGETWDGYNAERAAHAAPNAGQ